MYRICRKIPDSFQGDFGIFVKKWYILKEFLPILRLISWSLPDDEGGITCMIHFGEGAGNNIENTKHEVLDL